MLPWSNGKRASPTWHRPAPTPKIPRLSGSACCIPDCTPPSRPSCGPPTARSASSSSRSAPQSVPRCGAPPATTLWPCPSPRARRTPRGSPGLALQDRRSRRPSPRPSARHAARSARHSWTLRTTDPGCVPSRLIAVHALSVTTLTGDPSSVGAHAGKTLLIVNVASKCGLTPQYAALQQVYDQYAERGFEVLGFPCNQFGAQEPG